MPRNLPSFLSSETFEVQSRDSSFTVHAGILAAQSELLRSAITDGATEKKIDFSNWDSDTVEQFLRFLYIGDYEVPERIPYEGAEEDEERDTRDGINTPDTEQSLADREHLGPRETNVLLVHAKIYALGQYSGVKSLQVMALERLRKALREIDGQTPEVKADIIELLSYVYLNKDPHRGPEGPMRDLVSKFTAGNIEVLGLMEQPEMESLLSGGGDFAVGLVKRMTGRLYGAGGELCRLRREMQGWKNRAFLSEKKMRQSETTNAKMWQLEAKMRQLEVVNAEKVRLLEAINVMKMQQLVTANTEKVQQLEAIIRNGEAASAEKMQQLETKIRVLEITNAAKMRYSVAANAEKIQQLEAANTKMRQSDTKSVENIRQLESINTEMQELKNTSAERLRQLEARNAEILELECTNSEMVQRLRDIDVKTRQAEVANAMKMRELERKVEWFEAVCPERAQEYRVPWLLRLLNSPGGSICSD